jgi:hypothetical protein
VRRGLGGVPQDKTAGPRTRGAAGTKPGGAICGEDVRCAMCDMQPRRGGARGGGEAGWLGMDVDVDVEWDRVGVGMGEKGEGG